VGFIFITLLLDVLGFGLLIPVAPRLIEHITGWDDAQVAPVVGWLGATYAAMQFFFAPALGLLSDRFGRRPVILIALFGSGLDYFAMSLANTLPILFITRAINGLSGASFTVASAYIADVTPPEKRAAGFGMIGAAFGLGFVFGPLIGGFLGDPDHWLPFVGHGDVRYPFYAAGILTLCNWLYGFFVLPESLPRERRGHFTLARANPVGAFHGLGRYPMVAALAAAFFFSNLAQFGLHATWVLYLKHRFDWSPRAAGLSLFAVGLCAAIVQGGLAARHPRDG
jgi:DHA1 family tetracycline resistance protein-like MFS transporter